LFYCMYPRFYQKILPNYGIFFRKKLRYMKSRISTKFHRLLFLFYFFIIYGIFCSVLFEGIEILSTNSENF